MKISDYLNIPWEKINKMSYDELVKYQKAIGGFAERRRNKALTKIMNENLPLPTAYKETNHYAINLTYDFGVTDSKGTLLSINDIKRKISVTRRFLKTKTSTVGGWKKTLQSFGKRMGIKGIKSKLTKDQYDMLWRIYNKVEEQYKSDTSKDTYDSTQRQTDIYNFIIENEISQDMLTEKGIQDIIEARATNRYEEAREKENVDFLEDGLNIGASNEHPITTKRKRK